MAAVRYQYATLRHPESIRILVLHPAPDRNAPVECSFLDVCPVLPSINEWKCRSDSPRECCVECFDDAEPSDSDVDDTGVQSTVYDTESQGTEDSAGFQATVDDTEVHSNEDGTELQSSEDDTESQIAEDGIEIQRAEDDTRLQSVVDDTESQSTEDSTGSQNTQDDREWHETITRPPGFPEYEAVSYTWGDASDMVPVVLGSCGFQAMVTRNCLEVLCSLRKRDSTRLLWIDSLCINQEDVLERTSQVRIMGRVYAASYRVVVHLGEETPSSRLLFEELGLAMSAPSVLGARGCWPDRPKPGPEVIQAMEDLFERPWFRRVWVLQEVRNSRLSTLREATVVCGSAEATMDALNRCAFGYSGTLLTADCPLALRLSSSSFTKGSLWYSLLWSRRCLSSDPRDKAFALRSLVRVEEPIHPFEPGKSAASELDSLIDCSATTEQAFTNVGKYLLRFEIDLWLITAVFRPHGMNMPSWIPNLLEPLPRWILPTYHWDTLEPDSLARPVNEFDIERYECDCCSLGDHFVLQVKGYMISSIQHLGAPFSFEDLADARRQIEEILSIASRQADDDLKSIAVHPSLSTPVSQRIRDLAYSWADMLNLLLRGPYHDTPSFTDEVNEIFLDSLQGFCLFRDSRNQVGLVPKEALPGDRLCFIVGAFSPVLLRPRSSGYGMWQLVSGFCSVGTKLPEDFEYCDLPPDVEEEVIHIW